MAGYLKELLLDYSLNRLSVDTSADLSMAITKAFLSNVFEREDFAWFELYLQGYTAIEIAAMNITTTDKVEQSLERIFIAIETYSGYYDRVLLRKVENDKSYRRSGIRELEELLYTHGKRFDGHEIMKG